MAYLYDMLSIAYLGDVDMAAVITYTIEGLPGLTQSKNFMYEATTLKEFKVKLRSYEILQGRSFETNESTETMGSNLRCSNCGSKTHNDDSCPHKEMGKRCFKCNAFGHMSNCCPNGDSTTSKEINIIHQKNEEEDDDVEKDLLEWTQNELDKRMGNAIYGYRE